MTRDSLLAELERYDPADDRERAMSAEVTAFVRDHPDCFERSLTVGHVTASAWVLDVEHRYALLTHHRKLDRWLQLGGHADGDADVRAVALREAVEESGLTAIAFASAAIYDIDVHEIPARATEPAHKHYDIRFAFVADRAMPTVVSDESHELAWRRVDELDVPGIDESVRRLARKTAVLSRGADLGSTRPASTVEP
jgi:8-oxo-dGTP pyrophosphatase MutT (NUDIX family)